MQCSNFKTEDNKNENNQKIKNEYSTIRLPQKIQDRLQVYSLITKNPTLGFTKLEKLSSMPHSTFASAFSWLKKQKIVEKNPDKYAQQKYCLDHKAAIFKLLADAFWEFHYPTESFQYTAKFKDISMENRPTPKEWRNLRKGIKQAQLYLGMDKFSSYADFAMTLSKFLEPTNDVKSLETKRLLIKAYPDWERLIPLTEINEQIKRLKAWELTDADRTLLEQIRHKTQN